jgi:hypothetical protein
MRTLAACLATFAITCTVSTLMWERLVKDADGRTHEYMNTVNQLMSALDRDNAALESIAHAR